MSEESKVIEARPFQSSRLIARHHKHLSSPLQEKFKAGLLFHAKYFAHTLLAKIFASTL
jgi:hypothetical protein